ncbi:MAG: recombinase family protein [Cyanobacteria bacterium P01_A01_bin.114]
MLRTVAYLYSDLRLEPTPAIWGWEVDQVYQDWVSGAAPLVGDRPQLQQLITDAHLAPPDYLLIRSLDELGDTLAVVGERLAVIEALGIVVIATEQDYCSSGLTERTPQNFASNASVNQSEGQSEGRSGGQSAQVQLMTLLSEVQHNQRSRRIRQGHAQKRIKGHLPPGRAPYGYRRGKDRYVVDRSVLPVVKDFFERFIVYGSLRGAVRYLEKRYGKKIAPSTGRRWLENPVYRGDTAHQDGRVVPDTHQAIISREEAAQVDRLLRRNRQLPPKTASAPRSLAGLVACATCGTRLKISRVTIRGKPQVYLYLRPTSCPRQPKCKAIDYDQALAKTIEVICTTLPRAVAQLTALGAKAPLPEAADKFAAQIDQKQAILDQLPALIASGILDQPTAELRAYQLRTEIAALRQSQSALPPVNLQELTQAVAIPQFWQDLSEAERRFFFREFIRQISIYRDPPDWTLQLEFIF